MSSPHRHPSLSPVQAKALFDVLVHHQLHNEVSDFKHADTINHYGFPFIKTTDGPTTSPLLQALLNKFVLPLPGLNRIDRVFWETRVRGLMAALADGELSESYDKGAIGARRMLATAASSLLEYVAKGMLTGLPRQPRQPGHSAVYDVADVNDVIRAWGRWLAGAGVWRSHRRAVRPDG